MNFHISLTVIVNLKKWKINNFFIAGFAVANQQKSGILP